LAAQLNIILSSHTTQSQAENHKTEYLSKPLEQQEPRAVPVRIVSKLSDTEMTNTLSSTGQLQHRIENDDGTRALGGPVSGSTPAWWHTTPEKYVADTLRSEMQIVQDKLNERWELIYKQRRYLGDAQTSAMLSKLEMAARVKVTDLKVEAQGPTDEMKRIIKLRDQGAFKRALQLDSGSIGKMLWEIAAGPEVAEAIFPASLKLQRLEDSSRTQKQSSGNSPLGRLQSIMRSSDGQFCIMVDGSVLSEGDTINACEIIRIQEDGVEYEKAGKILRQNLY